MKSGQYLESNISPAPVASVQISQGRHRTRSDPGVALAHASVEAAVSTCRVGPPMRPLCHLRLRLDESVLAVGLARIGLTAAWSACESKAPVIIPWPVADCLLY